MKQFSQEKSQAAPDGHASNLRSYISDLKKVATNNKQKRSHQQSSSYYLHQQQPQSTKNSGNLQILTNAGNSGYLGNRPRPQIQSEFSQDLLNQTQHIVNPLSPQFVPNVPPSRGGGRGSHSTNITPSNKRGNASSKSNILTSKAMAYLNSRKTNSFLKNYEEVLNSTKQFNGSYNKNLFKKQDNSSNNISFQERGRSQQKSRGGLREAVMSSDAQLQNVPKVPKSGYQSNYKQQLRNNPTKMASEAVTDTQKLIQHSQQRVPKEMIIRKKSSKSLLKVETPSNKQNQHQRGFSQAVVPRQENNVTDSTAAELTNDSNTTHKGQRRLGSQALLQKAKNQLNNSEMSQQAPEFLSEGRQRQQIKKIHTLGNTLGGQRKSLNISQNFGDSSLNEYTLAKTGKINGLNLTSLLKSNMLEEDGIEDMHFYFVSFNQHKNGILRKHEVVLRDYQRKKQTQSSKRIELSQNIKADKNNNKTIETVDEEDLL